MSVMLVTVCMVVTVFSLFCILRFAVSISVMVSGMADRASVVSSVAP